MGLVERVGGWVAVSVGLTSLAVGGVTLVWLRSEGVVLPAGLWLAQSGAAVVALALAQLGVRAVLAPARRQHADLQGALQRWVAEGDLGARLPRAGDRELAQIVGAINELLDEVERQQRALDVDVQSGRTLLASSPFGLALVGSDGRLRSLNPAARTLFGVQGRPEGRRPIEVIPVVEVQELVDAVLAGEAVEERSVSTGSDDLALRAVPTEDGVLVIAYDISRYRKAEQLRTSFVANVSHELRTPVATVMGFTETLLADRDQIPEDLEFIVDAIDRNVRRLRDLFEDLLVLHKVESRRQALPLELQPLRPLLEQAVISAADAASQRGLDFSLSCAAGLQAAINPEALGSIVGNLASNACKYTERGGSVRVQAREVGEQVLIEVIDDGIGIDPVHHERIFERFYRVDVGRSRRAGGTGLGLAIAKHLARACGADVTLQSALGHGSRFTVHLPRQPGVG